MVLDYGWCTIMEIQIREVQPVLIFFVAHIQ
jgi:hypothetical protein